MQQRTKLTLATLAAALIMAAALSTASANHFSVSNTSLRATWSGLRVFGEGGIEGEARCPVTLEGTLHSATIAKTLGLLVGYITRASSGSGSACTRGSSTIVQESLPWHLTYEGFTGTLPRIAGVRASVRGVSFRVDPGLGIACRYGHAEENSEGTSNIGASGEANSVTVSNVIRLRGFGEFGCPPEIGLEGTSSSLSVLGSTTRITVRLI